MQSARVRGRPAAEPPPFGALLRRLRTAQTTYARRANQWRTAWVTAPLSQHELASRAGVDAAHVNRLERGTTTPSRAVAERLAEALELDDVGTSHLLIAAGYWPWHELDADTAMLVAQTAIAVIAGDYRQLEHER